MNPKPKTMKPSNIIPTLAALALGITSSYGTITFVNSGSLRPGADEIPYTLSFDPGASATAIVVAVVSETNGSPGDIPVTFDGIPLVPVLEMGGGRGIGFYYLNNPSTGGAFDLTVDYSSVGANNGQAFGIVSLNASNLIIPVTPVADISSPGSAALATLDVDLNVPFDDSFILAALNTNGGAAGALADSPLVTLFQGDQGSLGGAAGYLAGVAAGNQTYSLTATGQGVGDSKRAAAVAFNVIPEPSVALLGCLGALALMRRRR